MLFLPWRNEATDLYDNHNTYADSYKTNAKRIRSVEELFVKNSAAYGQATKTSLKELLLQMIGIAVRQEPWQKTMNVS
jgi:hypothetical protein